MGEGTYMRSLGVREARWLKLEVSILCCSDLRWGMGWYFTYLSKERVIPVRPSWVD